MKARPGPTAGIRDDILRLGVWNCEMGLRNKRAAIDSLDVDLCVVPECGRADLDAASDGTGLWMGNNPHKGLGVFSPRGSCSLTPLPARTRTPWFMPVECAGSVDFSIVAVWSFAYKQSGTALAQALMAHGDLLADNTVIAGDFNASAAIAAGRKYFPASRWLSDQGLVSAYHSAMDLDEGNELHPTFWRYHREALPFHIDYCFVPSAWTAAITNVSVGSYREWAGLSDHSPLVVEFDVERLRAVI